MKCQLSFTLKKGSSLKSAANLRDYVSDHVMDEPCRSPNRCAGIKRISFHLT
jgi:hypothetical protein